jgi:hypothetical protein
MKAAEVLSPAILRWRHRAKGVVRQELVLTFAC